MENRKKRTILIIAGAMAVLLLICAVLLFKPFQIVSGHAPSKYIPGEPPEGVSFAELGVAGLSEQDCFAAYDPANDPAHPVLNAPVKVLISNLGSRPGQPRLQDLAKEYPQLLKTPEPEQTPAPTPVPSPGTTLRPGLIFPGVQPVRPSLPSLELPKLYLIEPDVKSPQFTCREYTLRWVYSAGRDATFTVSLSSNGGKSFKSIADGLTGDSITLTFPKTAAEACVLRVTAMVGDIEYALADTRPFMLAESPETPAPVKDYVDPQVQYTDMPGVRIASTGESVWFKAESSAGEAARLIWQISDQPFWGTKESFAYDTPLASGEIGKDGEFSVDLPALCKSLRNPSDDPQMPFVSKRDVYSFYVRAIALDQNGLCIGDPGQGIFFTYGAPEIRPDLNLASLAQDSHIAVFVQMPYYTEYEWRRISPDVLNRDISSTSDMLLLSAIDGDTEASAAMRDAVQVEIQVATSAFSASAVQDYKQPTGLVYSYVDTAPDVCETVDGYSYMTPWYHGIEYKEFALKKDELDQMGGIYYYARAVFYVPDQENPSALRPVPSETLTIAYRVTKAAQNEVKQLTVRSNLPFVQFLRYVPVQWQDPNYNEYFEVTRHIEAEEMCFSIKKTDGSGDFLLPYDLHIAKYDWTREQYQQKLDEMLPIGASFRYVKSEPAGFWHEFFSLLSDIYNSVKDAYAGAKDAVVSTIDYIPLIGDDAREYLKKAARIAIDYGLASIGLPPSLPNLDVLAEGSMDYVLRVAIDEALKQANVPADSAAAKEITEQVTKQVAEGMANGLKEAIIATRQNPFNVDFLRLSTQKLYRPAYVDVLVSNYSDIHASPGGTLGMSFGDATRVYKPSVVPIPPLKPGEFTIIRVYPDHVRNLYDGYGKYFDEIYYGRSHQPFQFRLYTMFDLPDVKEAAKAQGLAAAPLPYVTEYVYDHAPYEYVRSFVPAEYILEEDNSVNPADYYDKPSTTPNIPG